MAEAKSAATAAPTVTPPVVTAPVVSATQTQTEAVAPAPVKKRWVTPLHGSDIQDPNTKVWIRLGGTLIEVTPWVQMQIDAGKLGFVEG